MLKSKTKRIPLYTTSSSRKSQSQPNTKKQKKDTFLCLVYCHSWVHGLDDVKKELKLPKNVKYYTNDINGTNEDIKIDLSDSLLDKNILDNNYREYDYIYLKNCPCQVYIDETERSFNSILFKNLFQILKNNGVVIITQFSDDAIETLTGKDVEYIEEDWFKSQPKYMLLSDAKFKEEFQRIKKEIKKEKMILLNDTRLLMEQFLKNSTLAFKLLNTGDNVNYVNTENLYKYFVLQKVQHSGGRKDYIHTGPRGGKYIMRHNKKIYI
jgi:hypothetical protein